MAVLILKQNGLRGYDPQCKLAPPEESCRHQASPAAASAHLALTLQQGLFVPLRRDSPSFCHVFVYFCFLFCPFELQQGAARRPFSDTEPCLAGLA